MQPSPRSECRLDLQEFFLYSGRQSLTRCVICKYAPILLICPFTFLVVVFAGQKLLILVCFIYLFCCFCCLWFSYPLQETIVSPKVTEMKSHEFFWEFYRFRVNIQVCDPCWVNFCVIRSKERVQLHPSACGYPVVPIPFAEKAILFPIEFSWYSTHFWNISIFQKPLLMFPPCLPCAQALVNHWP